ncbi:MAG: helix-turn-helix domain-containing protein [Lachnospirales bacterium]
MVTDYYASVLNTQNNLYSVNTNKAIRYILSNITQDISLMSIAETLELSQSYISRLFAKETGISITKFVNKNRIQYSIKLLLKNELSLHEIAEKSGFNSYNYFLKVFKEETSYTPSQFFENHFSKESLI